MQQRLLTSFILTLFLAVTGCSNKKEKIIADQEDNQLIKTLYLKDIELREMDAKVDTINLEEYDSMHRLKIFELLAEDKVITSKDKIRAAWILQHTAAKICDGKITSLSPENFLLAYKLSSAALDQLEKNHDTLTIRKENIPRIVAMNYDRYLLFTVGYQKFGTQFVFDEETDEMVLAPIDTTLSSDAERKKYNVESIHTLLSTYKMKAMPKR